MSQGFVMSALNLVKWYRKLKKKFLPTTLHWEIIQLIGKWKAKTFNISNILYTLFVT